MVCFAKYRELCETLSCRERVHHYLFPESEPMKNDTSFISVNVWE